MCHHQPIEVAVLKAGNHKDDDDSTDDERETPHGLLMLAMPSDTCRLILIWARTILEAITNDQMISIICRIVSQL